MPRLESAAGRRRDPRRRVSTIPLVWRRKRRPSLYVTCKIWSPAVELHDDGNSGNRVAGMHHGHFCSLDRVIADVIGVFQQSLHMSSYMAEQPWFSRIWRFQEAVLPNAVSVHFGVCVFPLNTMLRATQKMLYLAGTKGPSCCLSI